MYIANHLNQYDEIGYRIRDKNGDIRYRKFNNVCDNSLDVPKLREMYEKAYRRINFTFTDGRHEYTEHLINVTFKYSVKEFNKVHRNCYIKFGHQYAPDKFTDCLWIEDGELLGIICEQPVESPAPLDQYTSHFYINQQGDQFVYCCNDNFKTIMNTAQLRHDLYKNGFMCDGIKFVRFKRSSGSSRVGKCLFIDERLYSRMNRWNLCGLQVRKGREIDLAALESYIALTLSSIIDTIELQPENILLIDDYKDSFIEDVVATRIVDGRLSTQEEEIQITNNIWDGQSLLDTSVFKEYGYEDKGMLLLRNRMFKSCCFNTNIHQFFKDNGVKHIDQLNGYTVATDLSDIKIITTPSSIKYLKFGSFDKWLQNLDSTFGVVKHEKPTHYFDGQLVRTHYQLLNTLQLTYEEIEEFLHPSVEYIENIKEDPAYLKLHINYCPKELYPRPYLSNSDIVCTIMGINEDFCKTRWYQTFRNNVVRKIIKDLKSGKVLVHGNYSTLLGNPVEMLMESIGIFDGKTRIGVGCIHSTNFEYDKVILGSRSPHVTIGNILLTTNTANEEVDRYFNLSKEIVCVNSIGESLLDRLSGCDFDSDSLLLTDDPILIKAAQKNYENFKVPANLVESRKTKRLYTPEEQADLDIKTSVNKIGEIINLSQELNTLLWDKINNGTPISDPTIQSIYCDICELDVLSNLEIDKAKKEFVINIADEMMKIKNKYPQRDQNNKIIKPYFFAHISKAKGYYDAERKRYKKFKTTMDYVQQIMNKVHIKRSKPEETTEFIDCLHLDDFKINRVKYDQLYRIVDRAYRCLKEIKSIRANDDGDILYKKEAILEEKIKCYEYINRIRLNPHTMYWLMVSIATSEYADIRQYLLSVLLMHGNSGFFDLIKRSKKPMELLVPDETGNIEIFGLKYSKITF